MSLTDISFLFIFLPLALIACLFRGSVRTVILVLASLVFYSCGTPEYLPYIAILMCIDIAAANAVQIFVLKSRRIIWATKIVLALGITINAAFLLLFKFFYSDHILPIGISVFTFKAISMLVDIYRKKVTVSQNPLRILLYMLFFGQIISGPMSRYDTFFGEYETLLTKSRWSSTIADIEYGSCYFVKGFAKKTVLANIMKIIADETFSSQAENAAISYFWLGSLAFALQLYYDFSGYSDMAKGLSNVFGLGCPDNFDHPYCSTSISDFWRRWHMSLGTWLRDYVYIPLGGSRYGAIRTIINLLAVWILTAVWHGAGATFIAWGMINFLAVAIEKLIIKPVSCLIDKRKDSIFTKLPFLVIRHVLVLLFLSVQWVIFNSRSLTSGIEYIINMFRFTGDFIDTRTVILVKEYWIFIVFGIVFTMPLKSWAEGFAAGKGKVVESIFGVVCGILLSGMFLIGLSLVISGQNDPFLYGGF